MSEALEWLRIAHSNLKIGKSYYKLIDEGIRFEEFCYDLQQCVEKTLKALLIHNKIKFPKTHVISELVDLLIQNDIEVPETIFKAFELTQYAVETRYPDDYHAITEDEYNDAVQIAEMVYNWAEKLVK